MIVMMIMIDDGDDDDITNKSLASNCLFFRSRFIAILRQKYFILSFPIFISKTIPLSKISHSVFLKIYFYFISFIHIYIYLYIYI